MKAVFLYLQGSKEEWSETASAKLEKKISYIVNFKIKALKSKSQPREQEADKKKQEELKILEAISKDDFVILFDERGKLHKNSRDFSAAIVKAIESGRQRIVFVIGGPYGFSQKAKDRADLLLSLSPLTLNHHVAKVTALEQVYRALTIWKNIKYHND